MAAAGVEWQGGWLKPPSFDGLEEHWQEWGFVRRALLGGPAGHSQRPLDADENRDQPDISADHVPQTLGREGTAANQKMFFSLVMTVKGSVQTIIRGAPQQTKRSSNVASAVQEVRTSYGA